MPEFAGMRADVRDGRIFAKKPCRPCGLITPNQAESRALAGTAGVLKAVFEALWPNSAVPAVAFV